MISKTWVEISKKNLLHNAGQFLKLLKPETQFMAVVKSNAYGHGLREVVSIIHNSKLVTHNSRTWFGVDNLDEARTVLEIAPKSPVLVLGYTQQSRLLEAAKLGARITVYNWETVKMLRTIFGVASESSRWRTLSGATPLRVHVKVETGTTRQGIGEDEVVEYVKALKKIRGVEVEGISTHFADSEDTRSKYALEQLGRYNRIVKRLETAQIRIPVQHKACTAATMRLPQAHGNLVRVGIGMYGLWPSVDVAATFRSPHGGLKTAATRSVTLTPVLTWKTIVAQVKEVKKGTPVSYGLTQRVARDSKIAVLPIGYWDGYDRGLSKIGHVLIGGKRCKIVGRVCMNMCMADITDVSNVKPEDEVVLLGKQDRVSGDEPRTQEISAEEIAKNLDTINYEVVTRINPMLPRIII
ncbi:MAG: alanine racemase [bacterium]|nr:alanine racemase [bacterium]